MCAANHRAAEPDRVYADGAEASKRQTTGGGETL